MMQCCSCYVVMGFSLMMKCWRISKNVWGCIKMRGLLLLLGSWMNMMKDKREYAHDVVHVVEVLNLW